MNARLRNLLTASATALVAAAAITAPAAAADPQDCLPAAGVHVCTSPGHAGIHVPPPAPPNGPNYQGGPGGGPPHLPWIG